MSASWWALAPAADLSQGDILPSVLIGRPDRPPKWVKKASVAGGTGWTEQPGPALDQDGYSWFLGKAKSPSVIVLTYGCETDKKKKLPNLLVAPVYSIDTVHQEELREKYMRQETHHAMPLPQLPGQGDCWADLRQMMFVDRQLIDLNARTASLSVEGLERLWVQLMAFFTRREPNKWTGPKPDGT